MARRLVTPRGRAVTIEGVNTLQEKLASVLRDVEDGRSEVKRVWMSAALIIRDEARRRVPINKNFATGQDAWHAPGVLKSAIFAAYGRADAPNVLVGVNYKIAPQAHWIEYGTADRRNKSGANRGRVTAQPFMRPALTAKRAECVALIAQGYRQLIERAAQ